VPWSALDETASSAPSRLTRPTWADLRKGYNRLKRAGYDQRVTVITGSKREAHEVMPRVHMLASLLKRWLVGTHQGGVQVFHLDYYLDEFTFRFNRRTSRSRGLLFHLLLQQALATDPVPYRRLVHGRSPEGSHQEGAVH